MTKDNDGKNEEREKITVIDLSEYRASAGWDLQLGDALASGRRQAPEEGAAPEPDITKLLATNKKGEIRRTMGNLSLILRHDPRWKGRIWMDTFRRSMNIGDDPITDAQVTEMRIDIGSRYGWEPAKATTWDVLVRIAERHRRSSLQQYLDDLTWDGTHRLDEWLSRSLDAEDTPLYRAFSRRWCIGAVARAFQPGCKMDNVLLLVGPQGVGKSTSLRVLAGEDYFADTDISLRSKDAYLALSGTWIYEIAEMTSFTNATLNRVKGFISSKEDRFRPPYGRVVVSWPRQTVFAASTNDETPLGDPTGSRRYWPVLTPGPLDIEWLSENQEQIWAEAVEGYRRGEQWHLTDGEEAARREHEKLFMEMDPWTNRVEQWAETHDEFTLVALLAGLGIPPDEQSRKHQLRVGRILRQLGFDKRKAKRGELDDGSRRWIWFRGPSVHGV